ncbi:hypothetical protein LHYA1_G001938 [Lachnellula hyalina]|uniref:Mitochondrial adapter protein MCP1 transmembrane domain-containing protein n=1 Tax=Lachnellula hyalina TaxID=1316788 RepID=A0A8H8U1P1_9HELO|nr:uncharacterized protein LHYA1_G001938 [Lachnellula hyalina]TVY28525.1 hypothetical protein LHYA1_G001938 [Lachnellula hyalina]
MEERRESTASEEAFFLQQLEPSPIESPSSDAGPEKQLPDLPSPPHSLGLSGSGHGVAYYQPYLLLTRPYYQSFPLEPLLITLPITTHILSGLALRIHRRNGNLKRYGAANLSISSRLSKRLKVWPAVSWTSASGYILAPLVLTHAFVNRILPWVYEGGSSGVGLGYVAHGFARHPAIAWTGYVALVATASGHFVWGAARWNGWVEAGNGEKAKRRWWVINGVAIALAGLWMAGGLGVVGTGGLSEGWIGKGYDVLYSKVPLVKL